MKDKKLLVGILSILGVLSIVTGVTVAFFNYTRTGAQNTVSTGRIYFNHEQGDTLHLTNMFPLSSTQAANANLDSVTVDFEGDTTYSGGEEYLISIVEVNNTVNGKRIPLNYTATISGIAGLPSNDYWNQRGSSSKIYQLNTTGEVEENKQILVGFIPSGATGVDGTLTIKAYIDSSRIAISDTLEGGDITVSGYTNGTNNGWQDGRVILTTAEWNQLQGNSSISFKIKAESNEGIWVEEPLAPGQIESCPGCKFMYTTSEAFATWNTLSVSPTVVTSKGSDSYLDIVSSSGKNYFLGVKLNGSNQVTNVYACGVKDSVPFCVEGTSNGSTYTSNQTLLQSSSLWNNTCTSDAGGTVCGSFANSSIISASTGVYGSVITGMDNNNSCYVYTDGYGKCYDNNSLGPVGPTPPDPFAG